MATLGRGDAGRVAAALEGDTDTAIDRHQQAVAALGLALAAVGWATAT